MKRKRVLNARRGQVGERADEIRGFLKIASKTPPGADKIRSSDHPKSPPGADKMRSSDHLKEKSETLSILKQLSSHEKGCVGLEKKKEK